MSAITEALPVEDFLAQMANFQWPLWVSAAEGDARYTMLDGEVYALRRYGQGNLARLKLGDHPRWESLIWSRQEPQAEFCARVEARLPDVLMEESL